MTAGPIRHVVVGVAGHIDHGKSTLVKALTGTDPDRLPEEKLRGITIDLGFAHLDVGDVALSFVDAPGHEKFVHNMLVGATGIDLLLLVVAADESVMPQTREHFGICRLLGLTAGVVALTRIDLADSDMIEIAEDEVRQLVRGTFLDGAPIVKVSGATGAGVADLSAALLGAASRAPERRPGPWPRLPVDRVFAMKGFGTVVTGTLTGGVLRVGDNLAVTPGERRCRVRGLQVHGASVEQAGPHGRVAANLLGIERDRLWRGAVLVPPEAAVTTLVFDAQVDVLAEAPAPLADGQRVRVHHGAAEVLARLRLPAPGRLEPGRTGACQFRLEAPLAALPGDRFVVRRYSPVFTLAGGVIADLDPPRWRRADPRWPEHVVALAAADDAARLALAAGEAGADGFSMSARAVRLGLSVSQAQDLARSLAGVGPATGAPLALLGDDLLVGQRALDVLAKRLTDVLTRFHREQPLDTGLAPERLRSLVAPAWRPAAFRDWLERLAARGRVSLGADAVALATHTSGLDAEQARLYASLLRALDEIGLLAAPEEDWLRRAGAWPAGRTLTAFALRSGDAVRLNDGAFLSGKAWRALLDRLRDEAAAGRTTFEVPDFKEWFGLTRKHAIPILERLDDQGVTQRVGNQRRIRSTWKAGPVGE